MLCHFGEIKSDVDLKDTIKQTMILNEFGKIAQGQWFWLAEQYPYVRLHEFVVMPNHIHGIIEIDQNLVMKGIQDRSKPFINIVNQVSSIKIKSISELMGAYKTTVSKRIHLAGNLEFAWHRSFHDHLIKDEKAYQKISNYIINNPILWKEDKFYKI